ncbi:hypothetical protein CKA32_000351 [Geitlerinema sp. FC II]|nr:hypothetical protein CKA32_000351 [Geitlerinema sp. FC II]
MRSLPSQHDPHFKLSPFLPLVEHCSRVYRRRGRYVTR